MRAHWRSGVMTNTETRRRQKAERRGRLAEWAATALLVCKGYRVLAQRARTPLGEIDLIVKRGGVIAFIEVKQRRQREAALDAVAPRQQRRIIGAASWWLARHPAFAQEEMRFDVVCVTPLGLPRHDAGVFGM